MLEQRIEYKAFLRLIRKWLNRRSQRKSFSFNTFREILKFYGIERPRITEVNKIQLTFSFS